MLNPKRTRSQSPACEPIVGGYGLGLQEGEWVAALDTQRKI